MGGPSVRCGLSGGVHPSILRGKLEPSCLIHPIPRPRSTPPMLSAFRRRASLRLSLLTSAPALFLTVFAVASALCSVAPNAGTLIGARALQGIGAALLTPGSLAIISATFREEDRSKAIGTWAGFSGVGTAIGPFLGGWLVARLGAGLVIADVVRHLMQHRDHPR